VAGPAAPQEGQRRVRWLRRSGQPAPHDEAVPEPADDVEDVEVIADDTPAAVRRIGEVAAAASAHRDDAKVRSIARLGEPVAPLVIDNFRPEPAYDPVIGPDLAAARTRVGLSVDELADRTRIRPHVIESIEVDDFAACGGDFYARGHIRTLARVLGKDPGPLLARFEERYASAPINARTVFEAELSTGMVGSMRRTSGGPNWALLVGAVLAVVLVWSLVRLLAGAGGPVLEDPPPMLNGSGGIGTVARPPQQARPAPAAKPVATTLTAVNGGTHVVVRDGQGAVVYRGDMVIGEVQQLEAAPPVTVVADDGSVLAVSLGGRDLGFLGEAQTPTTRTYARPSR
jgi:cytoskeleton protein RodZ